MAGSCPGMRTDIPWRGSGTALRGAASRSRMTSEACSRDELHGKLEAARSECRRLESLVLKREQALEEVERQLQQAQKMETLGTLVAGVAHENQQSHHLLLYNLPLLQKTWADFMPVLLEHCRWNPSAPSGGFTCPLFKRTISRS